MMNKKIKSLTLAAVLMTSLSATAYAADKAPIVVQGTVSVAESAPAQAALPDNGTVFYGNPSSSISGGVIVPEGAAYLYTSGTVPPVLNKDGKTVYERYGDTKTQAAGVLASIEKHLEEQGLSMKDVVYLRAYLTADAAKEGKFDYAGWNEAYGEFFNNDKNPIKPARSTVGVASLVSSDWLIEIEAVAVFPKK